jgi:hypothetical protein
MSSVEGFWKKCTTCKKPIALGQKYWTCSVSTCTRARTGLTFCTVACFDIHVPVLNHKNAWACENTAPKTPTPQETPGAQSASGAKPPSSEEAVAEAVNEYDVLVVASKVKDYIRQRSGMNTSASTMDALSDAIRSWCLIGIAQAEKAGRKTLLDRDLFNP